VSIGRTGCLKYFGERERGKGLVVRQKGFIQGVRSAVTQTHELRVAFIFIRGY